MRKFKVEINMDGAAFDGNEDGEVNTIEVHRLLRGVLVELNTWGIVDHSIGGRLIDMNGNDCGRWRFVVPSE